MSDAANNMLTALIQALIQVQRRQSDADTALVRDIVADNRLPMHNLVSPELPGNKVAVVGASSIDNRKHSIEMFDAMMDIEDQRWRTERALELAKLGGGGK